MTVKINPKKSQIIIEKIKNFLDHKKPTTRQLASVIGSCISLFPALPLGKMHYRNLEKEKTKALKLRQGNFNSKLGSPNSLAVQELHWWLQHIPNACRHIHLPKIDFTIYTDASELGWGATDGCFPTEGRWGANEQSHINFLELKAVFLALNRYYESWKGSRHIRIKSDNTTAIAYLNNMGWTVSVKCNILSKKIWELCNENGCWISAEHVPGSHNTVVDYMSRTFNENTEWKLSPFLFQSILQRFQFIADIDLFASYLNKQLSKYVSWHPNPESIGVDAFNMSWSKLKFYAFPPFSLVEKSVSKIIQEKASGIMVIPWWPTQNWFPVMAQSLVDYPIILPQKKATLTLPLHENKSHPLFPKLQLLAIRLSGKQWEIETFRRKLWTSSVSPGETQQHLNMKGYSDSGKTIAAKGVLIPLLQM